MPHRESRKPPRSLLRQCLHLQPTVAASYLFGCGGKQVGAVVPWLAFTGHTLMVGDMGRTELASAPEAGARALFESGRRLASLPDYIEVFPGAFSGSVCGRGLSGKPSSTIGFERRFNRMLRIEDRATFITRMLEDVPRRPPDAERVPD